MPPNPPPIFFRISSLYLKELKKYEKNQGVKALFSSFLLYPLQYSFFRTFFRLVVLPLVPGFYYGIILVRFKNVGRHKLPGLGDINYQGRLGDINYQGKIPKVLLPECR
jgi:hypothetical protein